MGKFIESMYAKNIGKYKEAKIIFNSRFNFLVGANGCGKTTLLKYAAIIFNPNEAPIFRYDDNASVWIDYNNEGKRFRIGLGEDWVKNGKDYRNAIFYMWKKVVKDKDIDEAYMSYELEKNNIKIAPLILGAYRRIEYDKLQYLLRHF